MHIIIGICLALTLLSFWLIGHWFARVLAFIGLAVVLGLAGSEAMTHSGGGAPAAVLGMCLGAALAWAVPSMIMSIVSRSAKGMIIAV
jgi:hypothetical protein